MDFYHLGDLKYGGVDILSSIFLKQNTNTTNFAYVEYDSSGTAVCKLQSV